MPIKTPNLQDACISSFVVDGIIIQNLIISAAKILFFSYIVQKLA